MTALTDDASATTRLGYSAIDADTHYYEPHDAFTRHLESRFADRSLRIVPGDDGLGRLYFGGQKMAFMKVTPTDYTGAPGADRKLYEDTQRGASELVDEKGRPRRWLRTDIINPHEHPAMMNKAARLKVMDEQGVEASLVFPTLAVAVEHEMHDDVDALYAGIRAFNRWLEEDWGYGQDGRIYAAPLISLIDPAQAVTELKRVLDLGARLVHLKKGPLYGESLASPSRDHFWAMINEAAIPVAFHTGDAGYQEQWATAWGESPRPPFQFISAFGGYLANSAAADTFANLIMNNLFERFPRVRILSIENGSSWVPYFLARMNKAARLARSAQGLGGPFTAVPSEVFKEHFYVSPFFEESPVDLAELIGPERVLFGSDWPHPEGLAEPLEFADKLTGHISELDVRRIMRSNTAQLVGLPS